MPLDLKFNDEKKIGYLCNEVVYMYIFMYIYIYAGVYPPISFCLLMGHDDVIK